jgi:ufm1-conjugating enzyme 1
VLPASCLLFSVFGKRSTKTFFAPTAVPTQIPVSYPTTPFEIVLPELEGKTPKMYRGGKICLSLHFKPLWSKNVPHFGIAHALAMGLGPWLAAEIPYMVDQGIIAEKSNSSEKK